MASQHPPPKSYPTLIIFDGIIIFEMNLGGNIIKIAIKSQTKLSLQRSQQDQDQGMVITSKTFGIHRITDKFDKLSSITVYMRPLCFKLPANYKSMTSNQNSGMDMGTGMKSGGTATVMPAKYSSETGMGTKDKTIESKPEIMPKQLGVKPEQTGSKGMGVGCTGTNGLGGMGMGGMGMEKQMGSMEPKPVVMHKGMGMKPEQPGFKGMGTSNTGMGMMGQQEMCMGQDMNMGMGTTDKTKGKTQMPKTMQEGSKPSTTCNSTSVGGMGTAPKKM